MGQWASVWARLRLRLPPTLPPHIPTCITVVGSYWLRRAGGKCLVVGNLYFSDSTDDVLVITVASDSHFKLYPSNFAKIAFYLNKGISFF